MRVWEWLTIVFREGGSRNSVYKTSMRKCRHHKTYLRQSGGEMSISHVMRTPSAR